MDSGVPAPGNIVLHLDPCIPRAWRGYKITFRYHSSRYELAVENPQSVQRGVAAAELDGANIAARPLSFPLKDDGAIHRLQVRLG